MLNALLNVLTYTLIPVAAVTSGGLIAAWRTPGPRLRSFVQHFAAGVVVAAIECDPKGKNPKPDLCKAANVQGFPTWEINGQSVSGTQSLEELAALSGYQGSRNFRNSLSPVR